MLVAQSSAPAVVKCKGMLVIEVKTIKQKISLAQQGMLVIEVKTIKQKISPAFHQRLANLATPLWPNTDLRHVPRPGWLCQNRRRRIDAA